MEKNNIKKKENYCQKQNIDMTTIAIWQLHEQTDIILH